jgi:Icc-related predicted phosphoesterase
MARIWHISDTHSYHGLLKVPEGIDTVISSGDCSNYRDPYRNSNEVKDFIAWYASLAIKNKIYVAGNHDTSIEKRLVTRDDFTKEGIIYLENESIELEGLKIWGSPFTPSFCDWSFMKAREKLHILWGTIPDNTNVVVVHGPPKRILDLSYDRQNNLEFCGCQALYKRVTKMQNLKAVLFGHIHNCQDIVNAGTRILTGSNTIYSNGSVVTDGKFGMLSSNGNILEL